MALYHSRPSTTIIEKHHPPKRYPPPFPMWPNKYPSYESKLWRYFMNGWKSTIISVYLITFKNNDTPHMIVKTKQDAVEYCKVHPEYDWDCWGVETRIPQLAVKIKRKHK